MTGRRAIVVNTLWNAAGLVLPLAIGVVAIPILVRTLGLERFGLLSLIWMLTGYFSMLDLGISRALTKVVAEKDVVRGGPRLACDVWTGLCAMCAFGLIGAAVLAGTAQWLVRSLLTIPEELQTEAANAIWFLVPAIPATIVAAGIRGVMDGLHLFRMANLIRIPLAAMTFLAPLAVAQVTRDLSIVSASLLLVRLIGLFAHWIACARVRPDLMRPTLPDVAAMRLLLVFGGWLTVTNVVGPLMTYLDRFVVGAVGDMATVAYYATPYDVVTKLLLVPFALAGVLFPVFSVATAKGECNSHDLLERSMAAVVVVLFPVVIVIVAFAREGIGLWLGEEFAAHSYRVLQWLAAGVLINAMAQVPFTFVQGAGRPDWIAKLHLIELPAYVAVLWLMLGELGIVGAAVTWTLRVAVDTAVLLRMAHALAPSSSGWLPPRLAIALLLGMAALAMVAMIESQIIRGGVIVAGVLVLTFLILPLSGRRVAT